MIDKKVGALLCGLFVLFLTAGRAFATIIIPPSTISVGFVTENPLSVCSTNPAVTGYYQQFPHCATITIPNYNNFSVQYTFVWTATPKEQATWTVTYTGTLGTIGYVDLKYLVVGVTYAPPGPSSNTFVNYQNSSFFGNTSSLTQSFQSSTTRSVQTSGGFSVAVAKGSVSTTTSTTVSQTSKSDSTITTGIQVQNGEKTSGTADYFNPVNHDYDTIWVWLNAAPIFAAGGTTVQWLGYGFDTTDQPSPDIVGIQLGYLNGDFGGIPPDIQTSINRSWAASQTFPSGVGPALTSADLAVIASKDPFSVSTYGSTYIGSDPPSPETADSRFTLSQCSSSSSVDYTQAGPSGTPSTSPPADACTLTYTNTSTQAQTLTQSNKVAYSVDQSLSGSVYIIALSANVIESGYLQWTTESQSSVTNTTTSTAALSIQGPPCNNATPYVGPCVPQYDAAGNAPVQFEIYQDNMYGSFMFAPVNYY